MAEQEAVPSLGRAIAERRRALGLTQEQLAEQLGVHKMTVAKYEGGQVALSVERLADIAAVLQLSLLGMVIKAGYKLEMPDDYELAGKRILPDFVVTDPATGRVVLVEAKSPLRSPEELAEFTAAAKEANVPFVLVDEGEAGAAPPTRLQRHLPLAVREYLAEFRLRLTKGGASEEEIDEALELMRSPQLFTFYKGGVPSEYNEEEVLRGMKAIGEGVVIPELRERGRKIK